MHRAPTFERFGIPISNSIPTIIRYYKASVTRRINELRNMQGSQIWQRNYYEHIIRNKNEYFAETAVIAFQNVEWLLVRLYWLYI